MDSFKPKIYLNKIQELLNSIIKRFETGNENVEDLPNFTDYKELVKISWSEDYKKIIKILVQTYTSVSNYCRCPYVVVQRCILEGFFDVLYILTKYNIIDFTCLENFLIVKFSEQERKLVGIHIWYHTYEYTIKQSGNEWVSLYFFPLL